MERADRGTWPPVDMVLRAPAEGTAAPAASPPATASADVRASAPDCEAVAEYVLRLMQRDLRLERERAHRAGGRRWRSSP